MDTPNGTNSVPTDAPAGKKRPGSWLLGGLTRMTGRLYRRIARSGVGRVMTGYRRLDSQGDRSRVGRPVSRGRIPVADAVNRSRVMAVLSAIPRVLYDLPLNFYGIFGLLYGIFASALYFIVPLFFPTVAPKGSYLAVASAMLVVSLAFLPFRVSLRRAVSVSVCGRILLNYFLCVPAESPPPTHRKMPVYLPFVAVSAAFVVAVCALLVHPFLCLWLIAALILLGLIFSYPEAGVLLSTAFLPFLCLDARAILPLSALILLTWCSYGLKLLRLHRTFRRDIADVAVLLLLGLILISGVGGVLAGTGDVLSALTLFALVSEYILIVRLMTTRTQITRCLIGFGVTAVVTVVASLLGRVDATALDWLTGSRGGDLIASLYGRVHTVSRGVGGDARILVMLMLVPILYAALVRARRLFPRAVTPILFGVYVYLMVSDSSLGALVGLACVTVLFCLLLDHRNLVAGLLILPATVGGVGWYMAWHGPISDDKATEIVQAFTTRGARYAAIWADVCRSPIGYGVSADHVGGNLALEVLITLGWQGFVVCLVALFLLVQKHLTALSLATTVADRALVVAMISGMAAALLRGLTHGFLYDPCALFFFILIAAIGSAFANILFEEHDVRAAESMSDPGGVDRVLRRR